MRAKLPCAECVDAGVAPPATLAEQIACMMGILQRCGGLAVKAQLTMAGGNGQPNRQDMLNCPEEVCYNRVLRPVEQ